MRVLMDAGVLYAIPCLLGLLFFNVSKFFLSPRTTLVTCLILKTLFTGGIPLLVAARGGISAAALYVAMAVNGFCTGLLQSQTAAVCGLLPGTTADSLAHIGSFVSALMTTFVQGALLVATPLGAPVDPKTRMYVLVLHIHVFMLIPLRPHSLCVNRAAPCCWQVYFVPHGSQYYSVRPACPSEGAGHAHVH